jgi:hypothetical protein
MRSSISAVKKSLKSTTLPERTGRSASSLLAWNGKQEQYRRPRSHHDLIYNLKLWTA